MKSEPKCIASHVMHACAIWFDEDSPSHVLTASDSLRSNATQLVSETPSISATATTHDFLLTDVAATGVEDMLNVFDVLF
eukprot:IDg7524t1